MYKKGTNNVIGFNQPVKKAKAKKVAKKTVKKVAPKKAAKKVTEKPREKPTQVMVCLEGFVDKKGKIDFNHLHTVRPAHISDCDFYSTATKILAGMAFVSFKKAEAAKKKIATKKSK